MTDVSTLVLSTKTTKYGEMHNSGHGRSIGVDRSRIAKNSAV
jgi:hypothetical protein